MDGETQAPLSIRDAELPQQRRDPVANHRFADPPEAEARERDAELGG